MRTNILVHRDSDGNIRILREDQKEENLWKWAGEHHEEYELANLYVIQAVTLR